MIVDAHCHASLQWFEPVEPLVAQMDLCGVGRAVLTQVLGQFDNSYQQQCLERYPARFASVGAIALNDEAGPAKVHELAAAGMVGLRLRPDARSPGGNALAVWRAAADCGMAISCGGPSATLVSPEFAALVGKFPEMPFVLEQLAGWTRPDCDREVQTRSAIMRLSRLPNVLIKLPTLGQVAPRQIGTPLPPAREPVLDAAKGDILIEALDSFGADRLMWGSDFPVVSSREGYRNALEWTRDLFTGRTQAEQDAIFGGTALRIFFR